MGRTSKVMGAIVSFAFSGFSVTLDLGDASLGATDERVQYVIAPTKGRGARTVGTIRERQAAMAFARPFVILTVHVKCSRRPRLSV